MPSVSKADMAIKRTAFSCALDYQGAGATRYRLDAIVAKLSRSVPDWAIDGEAYLKGARLTADLSYEFLYVEVKQGFEVLKRAKDTKAILADVKTPRELAKIMAKRPSPVEWRKRKIYDGVLGKPNCDRYATLLRERIDELSSKDPIAVSDGKRPLSAFAKAELDLRHEAQMDKLDALIKHGYRLCWLSAHADCSPRCAPWQGKLVDIVHESPLPSHRMNYKKDGHAVYSLKSIMAETDRYGYHNTIINGFNCRHHLIPYSKGSKPPRHVSEKERKREYEISQRLREYECKIRSLKRKALLYNEFDKKLAKEFAKQADDLAREYKAYAEAHGFSWHNYRMEV